MLPRNNKGDKDRQERINNRNVHDAVRMHAFLGFAEDVAKGTQG
jgi:hypothetical protein